LVVCTGGEPLLQLDEDLVGAFHEVGFEVAVETNGTRLPPDGVDWVCVSPKAGAECVLRSGHELKLVFPQRGAGPELFEGWDFKHFFLQPMDGPERERRTRGWRSSTASSTPNGGSASRPIKLLGIP
jgi:7-carboxy-7-deazaguanine synthase